MTTTTPHTDRRGVLGVIGGALWALSPLSWLIADIRTLEPGTATFAAVWATYSVTMVVGPALLVVAHVPLRARLSGRAGRIGAVVSGLGLAAVATGNGIAMAFFAAGTGTSVIGYVVSYLGYLVGFVGALLVGVVLLRRAADGSSRIAGWLLATAFPVGLGVGLLVGLVLDEGVGFAAAVSLPTGVAWVLLGRSLADRTATSSGPAVVPAAG